MLIIFYRIYTFSKHELVQQWRKQKMQQSNCCSGDGGQARASGGTALSPLGTNCTVLTVLVHGGSLVGRQTQIVTMTRRLCKDQDFIRFQRTKLCFSNLRFIVYCFPL